MVPVPEIMENNSEKNSTKAEKRKIETDASPSEAKKANINNSAEIFNSTRFKFLLRNQETVRYGELKKHAFCPSHTSYFPRENLLFQSQKMSVLNSIFYT